MLSLDPSVRDAFLNSITAATADLDLGSVAFAEFERELMSCLMSLGRSAMEAVLAMLAPEAPSDSRRWVEVIVSRLRMMSLFGTVSVERPLFREGRAGATRDWLSERLGVVAGFWTQPAAEVAALAVAEMPVGRARSLMFKAGVVPASRSSMLRLAHQLSELHESARLAHEEEIRAAQTIPAEATTVAVSLDGVMVMTVGSDRREKKAAAQAEGRPDKGPSGWKEASVGIISFYDAEGVRLVTRRYGRMPETNKETTKAWLQAELEHITMCRPDLMVLAIADGAANNWTFLQTLDANIEVVDFFHTAEHLHRHVSKANGAASLDTQAKLADMRQRLLHVPGAAEVVFQEMQTMREQAGTQAVSTTKTKGKRQPTYFERHLHRMDYPFLLANNLPIGSGVTESTCKLLLCDRLRRTGMRWSQPGGQAVLTLRAWAVSDNMEVAWPTLMRTNQRRLAA